MIHLGVPITFMFRRLLSILILLFAVGVFNGFSQAITINAVDPGPYTPGSTISALFSTGATSCFRPGNVFGLYLSDASGNFATEVQIGTFNGFYTTFVNGIIPLSAAPGTGYRLRVKSTAPALTSAASSAIEIKPGPATEARLTAFLLDGSNTEVFGFCSGRPNQSFNLTNESTATSSLVTARITNELTPGTPVDITFDSQIRSFIADLAHYTVFVKAVAADGSLATKAYLLVNNRALTTFSTQGSNRICLPGGDLELPVTVDGPNGIENNFPGNTYHVNWGDNREDIYTLCDIKNNGDKVSHSYSSSSCGQTFISGPVTEYNAFGINISVENTYCGRVGTGISTTAKVVSKPVNNFSFDASSCLNSQIAFTNTSDPGKNPNTNASGCTDNVVTYTWFVDGVPIAADKPRNFVFSYSFLTPGTHKIRLESNSSTALCPPDPVEKSICIQEAPRPSFLLNGTSGVTLCSPTILKPANTSFVDNTCSSNVYTWTVTGGTVTTVNGTNLNSAEPEFNFLTAGTYKIKLSISTPSCGTFSTAEQTIIVNSTPTAVLSADLSLCNLGSYEFSDRTSGPTRTTFSGTQEALPTTYTWSVTGGAFSFESGTNANSKFPVIRFSAYGTYTVTATHTNNCSTASDTQILTFKTSPIVDAGSYPAICTNETIALQGTVSEPVAGVEWIGGGGTFSPDKNTLNAIYTPSAAEKASGRAELTLRTTTVLPAPCNIIEDYVTIVINPPNTIISPASKIICTDTQVGYSPIADVPGSTFTWTVVSNSPNASGFAATGSGPFINDQLVNSDPLTDATVVYRIVPSSAGCTGQPFDLTVTITPNPVSTANALSPVICSGQPAGIRLSSNLGPTTRYTWTTTASSPSITGNIDNPFVAATTLRIDDPLENSGTAPGTITYFITPYSANGCPGASSSVTITVNPSATIANAGPDNSICSVSSYTLAGNNPSVGSGKWIVTGPAAGVTFADDTKYNTTVNGLQPGFTYTFRWTISTSPLNCSESMDEVSIVVTKPTQGGTTTGSVITCSGNNGGQLTLSGFEGTILRWESSVDNGLNWLPIAETSANLSYINLTVTTQFRAVVKSGNCATENSTASTITVTPATVPANAGNTQTLCNVTSFTLTGNNPAPNTGMWTLVSGTGVVITNPNSNITTVTGAVGGQNYQFKWTITGNVPCPPTSGIVNIINLAPLQNTISSTSTTVCSGQTILVSGSLPTGGNGGYTYAWESSPDGSSWSVISGQSSADLNLILTGTLSFRRIVKSGPCELASTPVRIIAQPPISGNTLTGVPSICADSRPATLKGSTPSGGDGVFSYQWQSSINGSNWIDINGATVIDFDPPVLTATTNYRRIVRTLACTGPLENTSAPVMVTVNPNAKAEFNVTSDVGCAPFSIDAQNIKAIAYPDRNASYTWLANGVPIPGGNSITFPGYVIPVSDLSVEITLQVTSSLGCGPATFSHTFSTPKNSTALFTSSVTEGCGPLTVSFSNASTVPPGTTFSWSFGNGTSASPNPAPVTFLPDPSGDDKIYEVTLVANTPCGPTAPFKQHIIVRAKAIARFVPSVVTGCSPLDITFTNTSPDASNTSYVFDFDDGQGTFTKNDRSPITHRFETAEDIRTFHVKMTAKGECSEDSKVFVVTVAPNRITAGLVVNSTEDKGCAPFTVNFHNQSKGASKFEYNFGDTKTQTTFSSPEIVKHTFMKEGRYPVTMRASNGCNFRDTTVMIEVLPQPKSNFSAGLREGCPGLEVQFEDASTDAVSYRWEFGDGEESFEKNPLHTFKGEKPYYTVKLTTTNSMGCPNTLELPNYIQVFQPSVADFTALPGLQTSIPNYTFRFLDASTRNPGKWHWDFGDGNFSDEKNPSHTYEDVGSYTVTLTVSNQTGCETIVRKTVSITGTPGYLYVPNSFIPGSERSEFRLFQAKGSGLQDWKFSIFNKWGQLLWETTKLADSKPVEGWDGTFKGEPVPQGIYFWKIEVRLINGSEWKGMSYGNSAPKRTGIINLIR